MNVVLEMAATWRFRYLAEVLYLLSRVRNMLIKIILPIFATINFVFQFLFRKCTDIFFPQEAY